MDFASEQASDTRLNFSSRGLRIVRIADWSTHHDVVRAVLEGIFHIDHTLLVIHIFNGTNTRRDDQQLTSKMLPQRRRLKAR